MQAKDTWFSGCQSEVKKTALKLFEFLRSLIRGISLIELGTVKDPVIKSFWRSISISAEEVGREMRVEEGGNEERQDKEGGEEAGKGEEEGGRSEREIEGGKYEERGGGEEEGGGGEGEGG